MPGLRGRRDKPPEIAQEGETRRDENFSEQSGLLGGFLREILGCV